MKNTNEENGYTEKPKNSVFGAVELLKEQIEESKRLKDTAQILLDSVEWGTRIRATPDNEEEEEEKEQSPTNLAELLEHLINANKRELYEASIILNKVSRIIN